MILDGKYFFKEYICRTLEVHRTIKRLKEQAWERACPRPGGAPGS